MLREESMTSRREFVSDLHAAGLSPEPILRGSRIRSLFSAKLVGEDLNLAAIDDCVFHFGQMRGACDQRARRDGIVVKRVSFKVPPPSDDYLVEQFKAAITPRTKVIEVTHITNLTGQIMPVRQIMELAKPRGIEVFVDGAHAFAHFPFKRDELKADYYGTSLHKWLLAPVGTGFLYVRKEKQKNLWPLMAAAPTQDIDIRKYEEIGTHPAANHNAISAALAFHRGIGEDRKIARLRYLRYRWA